MGSKLGWIISGAIVLIIIIVMGIAILGGGGLPDPVQANQNGMTDAITIPVDPSMYEPLHQIPQGTGNAADLYKQAVEKIGGNAQEFMNALGKNLNPQDDPQNKAILLLLEKAATQGIGNDSLTFTDLPDGPSISPVPAVSEILYTVAAQCAASYAADQHPNQTEADKAYNACFVFGYRLWTNGVFETDRLNGLAAMSAGSQGYVTMYKSQFPDKPKAAIAQSIYDALGPAKLRWIAKEKIVHVVQNNLGDLIYIADHDKDRTWQVEALRWIGPLQWAQADAKQRKTLQKWFDHFIAGTDPFVAKTAQASKDFSQTDARSL